MAGISLFFLLKYCIHLFWLEGSRSCALLNPSLFHFFFIRIFLMIFWNYGVVDLTSTTIVIPRTLTKYFHTRRRSFCFCSVRNALSDACKQHRTDKISIGNFVCFVFLKKEIALRHRRWRWNVNTNWAWVCGNVWEQRADENGWCCADYTAAEFVYFLSRSPRATHVVRSRSLARLSFASCSVCALFVALQVVTNPDFNVGMSTLYVGFVGFNIKSSPFCVVSLTNIMGMMANRACLSRLVALQSLSDDANAMIVAYVISLDAYFQLYPAQQHNIKRSIVV